MDKFKILIKRHDKLLIKLNKKYNLKEKDLYYYIKNGDLKQ